MKEGQMIKVEITPELICSMLTTGNEIHARIEDGLPEGAKLTGISPSENIYGNYILTFSAPGHEGKKSVTVTNLRQEVDELRKAASK